MKKPTYEHVIPEEYTPIRKVTSTYGSISGYYPFKGTECVRFESMLERDYLARLETFNNVLNVISQPLTLRFTGSNSQVYPYTPDFLVNFKGPPHDMKKGILVEVKPRDVLIDNLKIWKPKFKAAFKYCNEHDLVFHFMDETRIRDQRGKNANFLQRYRKRDFDAELSTEILKTLSLMGTASFDHLLTRHFRTKESKGLGISQIWHLVSTGKIDCDLSLPLNYSTELWISDNDYK